MAATKIEKFLTIEEASEMISMPVGTIREKVKKGLLPVYKPGKRVLFDPADLRAFVKKFKKDL